MNLPLASSSLLCLLATLVSATAAPLPLKNPGFESGLDGWILLEKDFPTPMTTVTADAAHEGSAGLRVDDQDRQLGSSLVSQPLPAQPGRTYRLSFFGRTPSGKKGGVYLRFQDASRKIINSEQMPSVGIEKTGGWSPYTLDAVAPEGTATIAIWVHSWSGATGVMEFDDFALEEIDGPAQPAPAAAVPKQAPSKSAPREMPPMIVLKLDDLRVGQGGKMPNAWQRVLDILKAKQVKGSIGIICDSLEKGSPQYIEWIKQAQQTGLVEFWFHGLDHAVRNENGTDAAEFVGRPYEEQKRRFEESLKLAQEKLGFPLHTFGPPGGGKVGSFDEATFKVMADVPDMKVWLYPQPMDDAGRQLEAAGKVTILDRAWPVNIEQPLFVPSAEKLIQGYAKFPQREYFVLQGHPAHWKEEGFAEFEKIIDFLQQQNAVFVTPSECAVKVSQKTAQSR
jgi:peptidoglycan/xylan/chitin deacetylase (PgdA/CDA1 family)